MTKIKQIVFTVMSVAAAFSCLVGCTKDSDPGMQEVILTYHTNGATDGPTPAGLTGRSGESILLDRGISFSRDGHTFSGWNTSSDGTGTSYAAGASFMLSANTTLYAQWESTSSSNALKITVGARVFTATLEGSATGAAFREMLPLTLDMSELGGVEKYGTLPSTPPANASNPGRIQNGDLMLYGSNTLVLFYSTFNTSYSYTRIGRVDQPDGLAAALGAGNVTVRFESQ